MLQRYYFIRFALQGQALITKRGKFLVTFDIKTKKYNLWYCERFFKPLVCCGCSLSKFEALFSWNILLKEGFDDSTRY